jgi:hypothetical protein
LFAEGNDLTAAGRHRFAQKMIFFFLRPSRERMAMGIRLPYKTNFDLQEREIPEKCI